MAISILVWIGVGLVVLFFLVYGIIVFLRKRKWYVLHILGDYTNPHNPQATFLLAESFEHGVWVGNIYGSYLSWFKKFRINSIPDLQSYQFGKHLFVYRGVTGLAGDINYTFVLPPIIAKPSADKLVGKTATALSASIQKMLATLTDAQRKELQDDPSKLDDFILKIVNQDWVKANIGIVDIRKEDVLLREDRVVYDAISQDNKTFGLAHMDNWQKLAMLLWPVTVIAIVVGASIGMYVVYQGFQQAQQQQLVQNQQLVNNYNHAINTTNQENMYLYEVIRAINVYGVPTPKNLTPLGTPTAPASSIPQIP